MQVRQGDVMIVGVNSTPTKLKAVKADPKFGAYVLAYGEVTGHAHTIEKSCVEDFQLDARDGTLYFTLKKPSAVKHQEHTAISLSPGTYKAIRQKQYHRGEVRNVAD